MGGGEGRNHVGGAAEEGVYTLETNLREVTESVVGVFVACPLHSLQGGSGRRFDTPCCTFVDTRKNKKKCKLLSLPLGGKVLPHTFIVLLLI